MALAAEGPAAEAGEVLAAPFRAIRPAPALAGAVAARPYDVLSQAEAAAGAAGRPLSFLHVSRAEIDLPDGTDPHGDAVYAQAAAAFRAMRADGTLIEDTAPGYYAYRMTQGTHVQTGIALAGSLAAYRRNRIRRHEHTRPDKETDRTRQIEAVGAHTGPVLACHPPDAELARLIEAATAAAPVADATTDDGTRHQVWRIAEADAIDRIGACFAAMPAIYIADGHHRSAAAARVDDARRQAGQPSNGRFLVVSFPADGVRILDYNRVVRDLGGATPAMFVGRLRDHFQVLPEPGPVAPARPGEVGLYVAGAWFRLVPRPEDGDGGASPVDRLDVSRLSRLVLEPLLGITDPRTDPRIDFVGGGRGLAALVRRVDADGWAAAFALYPTRLADLMAVADAGLVMPPKSTWFEPKLADGLLSLPIA
jgi:uncharacterized protein (DUF1015 family)